MDGWRNSKFGPNKPWTKILISRQDESKKKSTTLSLISQNSDFDGTNKKITILHVALTSESIFHPLGGTNRYKLCRDQCSKTCGTKWDLLLNIH